MSNIKRVVIGPFLALTMLLASCAIFQSDPVGSSLVTMRNAYEAVIQESGRAYQAKAITKAQLDEIVAVGRKFYDTYNIAVSANLLKNEADAEKFKLQAAALLAQLQDLARKFYGYKEVK